MAELNNTKTVLVALKGDRGETGAPKGVATSSTILAYTEDKGIWIGSDTGHWYYWSGAAYADGGVYQATEIENGSVTPIKTSFITNDTVGNILSLDSMIWDDQYVASADGTLNHYDGYGHSPYMSIDGGRTVKVNMNCQIAFFDSNKTFISGVNLYPNSGWAGSISPVKAAYVIVSYDQSFKDTAMLIVGINSLPDSYEQPQKVLDNVACKITEGSITPTDLSFITKRTTGNILYDDVMIWDGYYANYENGNFTTYASYGHSKLIPVSAGDILQTNVPYQLAIYDGNKNFISGVVRASVSTDNNIMPSNAKYVIFSIDKKYKATAMLWVGGNMPSLYNAPIYNMALNVNSALTEIPLEHYADGYINNLNNGTSKLVVDSNWVVYKTFLHAGDKIRYRSDGFYNGIVVLISKDNHMEDYFSNIVTCDNNDGVEVINEITIDADGYYYFCNKANTQYTSKLWLLSKHNKAPSDYVDLSVFRTIGIIGDSYASGEMQKVNSEGNRTGWKDIYDISWGQIMARDFGIEVTNYTKGGLGFKSWVYDGSYGFQKFTSDTKKDLYVIALGLNNSHDTLGTIDDIPTYADTIYGNISNLLHKVISGAPNSKFIITTIPYNDNTEQYFPNANLKKINQAIIDNAKYYGIPVGYADMNEYFLSKYYKANMTYAHPDAVSIGAMAEAYSQLIVNCAVYYNWYFKNTYVYLVDQN